MLYGLGLRFDSAAFGRLCVETAFGKNHARRLVQPPSGGCVLKLQCESHSGHIGWAAAFGRLCVETFDLEPVDKKGVQPPSGGCVLKLILKIIVILKDFQPPSGGCVLKPENATGMAMDCTAAFGRLCVETGSRAAFIGAGCSRLRAAVC